MSKPEENPSESGLFPSHMSQKYVRELEEIAKLCHYSFIITPVFLVFFLKEVPIILSWV